MFKQISHFYKYVIPSLTLFILVGFLLTLSVNVHAESYFPMQQDENDLIPDSYYSVFDSYLDSENNYIFVKINLYNTNYHSYYWVTVSKDQGSMMYGEISNDGTKFSLYNSGSGGTYKNGRITFQKSNGAVTSFDTYSQNPFTNFGNLPSSSYDTSKAYVSNFKLMSNNSDSAVVVLKYGPDDPSYDVATQGHAVPPETFDDPVVNSGSNHQLPREVPEAPTINNYSWITYNSPSIDTSTIESLLESLIYVINYLAGWLKDNLAGEFANLISNIKGLFEFIGNTIQYYGGLIISNIQNGITTLYENFVALLEPITIPFLILIAMGTDPETGMFSIPYLTGVMFLPDFTDVFAVLVENDVFDVLFTTVQVYTKVPALVNQLIELTPSPVFHVPSLTYHGKQIGDFDISFSWYAPYKVYVDIILNAFLIIGYLYWLFVTFGSHLRGHFMEAYPNDPDSNARLFRG